MKNISLLGVSVNASAIIIDLISEIQPISEIQFYPNKDFGVIPYFPIKTFSYHIHEVGTSPPDGDDLFFGVTGPFNKKAIFEDFSDLFGIDESRYYSLIHQSAYIAPSCLIGRGVLIEPGVIISSQTEIEFGVSIKRGSKIGHHNHIGAFTDINPGVTISGVVKIGSGCTIGSGAVLKDNTTIGENTLIGMGSVVTKDIPANCVAFGNPCKVIRDR
jgi:sugar O-acyltransferase (sialic acid O-acetyltransferase NeuD family)